MIDMEEIEMNFKTYDDRIKAYNKNKGKPKNVDVVIDEEFSSIQNSDGDSKDHIPSMNIS